MTPPDVGSLGKFVAQVGVPAALALVVLLQLAPRIDRGIQIADQVDGILQVIAAQGCYPIPAARP